MPAVSTAQRSAFQERVSGLFVIVVAETTPHAARAVYRATATNLHQAVGLCQLMLLHLGPSTRALREHLGHGLLGQVFDERGVPLHFSEVR